MKLLLLALAWSACCALHSAMISESVTTLLKQKLGDTFRYYRLFFNLVAGATFIPLALYSRSIVGDPLFRWSEFGLGPVRYALVGAAVLLFWAGGRHYSLRQFIGISQARGTTAGGIAEDGGIDQTGILALVRHPWYTAVLLLLWAGDLDAPRLVVSAVLTAYVVVGTLLEERKLVRQFGDAYRSYQQQVSMFLPFKWIRARLRG